MLDHECVNTRVNACETSPMSQVSVQLLGRPCVHVDGSDVGAPKGAKPWALLAYLAVTGRSHPRMELAELLFSGAVDPLGALRWNLAALRRLLDRPDALKGDSIGLDCEDVSVDIVRLQQGDLDGIGSGYGAQELLAGLNYPDSPVFELWLVAQRERLGRLARSMLRELSLDAFARGDLDLAVHAATELVTVEPFDEGNHALLIRTLALSGARQAAQRQFDQCSALLRAELGSEPGPAVLAASTLVASPTPMASTPDADEVFARMLVAWQTFLAGSIDHALDVSRGTVRLADLHGDVTLRIAGRMFLAGMLNMSVRAWDEAATTTAQAIHLAAEAGRDDDQAVARSILAGSELMRGDYRTALAHAELGTALSDQPGARSLNLAFRSAVESDIGRHQDAIEHALLATSEAERTGDPVQLAYAFAYAAHAHMACGRYEAARPHLGRAIDACSSVLVLKPWPLAMLAEIDVRVGNLGAAAATATEADGLATVTGISYQRALAHRALALGEAAAGNGAAALDRLVVALGHARRTTGQGYTFHWPVAWVLESLATTSAQRQPQDAKRWAAALKAHASASGMSTFAVRADRLLAVAASEHPGEMPRPREQDLSTANP